MDGFENDRDIADFFEELLRREALSGAIEGIAKQIIGRGENSITGRQRAVVDNFIQAYEKNNQCDRCSNGNVTSLTDLIFISENGLCPMCDNDREKFMRD